MNPRNRQHGSTLFVGLVMLVVLTLLVISAIRSSNINLRIVGNMQTQREAAAVAQDAIEQIISSNFTSNPSSAVGVAPSMSGYTLAASAACIGSVPLTNNNLNPANAADAPCISSGTARETGLISTATSAPIVAGQSWCYAQQWDVQASAVNAGTGANVNTHQGVHLRVPAGTTCSD